MKLLKQFGIILLVTCVGEIIHSLLPLPIPGSIYGLVLMFVLLCTKVIKLEHVRSAAGFLIEIMPVMFIPAAVGLIDSWDQLQPILIPTVVIVLSSTVIVMVLTGLTAQFIIKKEGAK
ncbi:MAG: CidA/LrgA family protein [Solobacterium sp.]|nr:CidA/LrgA family protein [Solobacterium sp.]